MAITKDDFERNGIGKGSKLELMLFGFQYNIDTFRNAKIKRLGYLVELAEDYLSITDTWNAETGEPGPIPGRTNLIRIPYENIESYGEQELQD